MVQDIRIQMQIDGIQRISWDLNRSTPNEFTSRTLFWRVWVQQDSDKFWFQLRERPSINAASTPQSMPMGIMSRDAARREWMLLVDTGYDVVGNIQKMLKQER